MISIAPTKVNKRISATEIADMRKKDNELVKGRFICMEPRGGSFTFSFKKYKGDQTLTITMKDGQEYEVPRMIANHLNQNCWYPEHHHILDMDGNPVVDLKSKMHRCSFQPLSFDDVK